LCRNVAIIEGGNIIERDAWPMCCASCRPKCFVFNLRESRGAAPQLSGFTATLSDPHTLEIEMAKSQSLNDIFAQLSAQGIAVNSMRKQGQPAGRIIHSPRRRQRLRRRASSASVTAAQHCVMSMPASRAGTEWIGFKPSSSGVQPYRAHLGPNHRAPGRYRDPVLHSFSAA